VPEYMRTRFENWVNGMKWDWCVSRQRFYGVPFPVWYCNSCAEVIFADETELPVDPSVSMAGRKCHECGSSDISPESDVMDTWLTSSISTYIATMISGLPHGTVSVRFQAHDIISTWAYTSIVRGHHNFSKIPWNDIVVSGLVYDPTGEKVSKSRGNSLDLPVI
ncbi:valyl-tRNA synthetase, partial [mine drainage metagenome]